MARRKRMSRNKRLAIVLTIIILLVLIAPQVIRYYMNVADANAAAKQLLKSVSNRLPWVQLMLISYRSHRIGI